jgi:hypothetical protein
LLQELLSKVYDVAAYFFVILKQIHHTGHDHWILSIQDTNGTVFLLDSKNPRQTVSASTQIQMSRIYSSNGNVLQSFTMLM